MGVIVKSFKGITYNPEKVKIENVVTPPYDVISKDEQEEFYKKDEHNIIRLILGKDYPDDNKGNNRYIRARKTFEKWILEKILIQDNTDNLYYLEEEFEFTGKKIVRKGFIGILKLEEFEKGNIVPHERTLSGPKKDRFQLIKECRVNFSQIFGIFSDKELKINNIFNENVKNINPFFNFSFNNINYRFYKISDRNSIKEITDIMKNKKVFIADGHHRYETALMYRDYMRKKINAKVDEEYPFDYVMMYFCPMEEEGLMVLPTHRLVKNVTIDRDFFNKAEEFFDIEITSFKNIHAIGFGSFIFYDGEDFYHFKLKEKYISEDKLDVEILEDLIFKKCLSITDEDISNKTKIDFIKDEKEGIELVKNGKFPGIFILHPPDIEKVRKIAQTRGVLPQKSTYFYPKLLTGLVIYSLE